jgi:hypothetical protein
MPQWLLATRGFSVIGPHAGQNCHHVSRSRPPRRFATKALDLVVGRRQRYGGNVRDCGRQNLQLARRRRQAGSERANSAVSEGAFNPREVSER